MRPRLATPMLIALAGAGCMTAPRGGLPPPVAEHVLNTAASQVRRCYRAPRVGTVGRQIVTRLRLRLTAGGNLAGLPYVVAQTGVSPDNEAYAERMAEAAIGAVVRCAPLSLPDEAYRNGAIEIELTFSPLAAV